MKTYYVVFASGDPRSTVGLSPTFLIFNTYGTGVTPPGITGVIGATGIYAFQYGTTTPIAFLLDGATTGLASNRYISGSIDPADRSDEYGTTLVAIGTTLNALGTTGVALGTTNVALGVTSVALGITAVALGNTLLTYGLTTAALGNTLIAYGNTMVALGNTGIAFGTTNVALGTTNVALGITAVALGTSTVSSGITSVALGNTILAIAGSLYASSVTLSLILPFIGSTASSFGTNVADPVDLFGYLKRVQENLEGNQSFTKMSGALSIYSRGSSQLLINKMITNSVSMVIKT